MNLLNLDWSKILLKKKPIARTGKGGPVEWRPLATRGRTEPRFPLRSEAPPTRVEREPPARPVRCSSRHVTLPDGPVEWRSPARNVTLLPSLAPPHRGRPALPPETGPKTKKKILFFFCFCFCFWFPIIHSDLFNYFCIYWMVGCISASFNRNSSDLFGPKWSLSAVMKSDNGAVVTLVE